MNSIRPNRLLYLLENSAQWINRRVETFDYTTGDMTRTRVSIDLTLPADFAAFGAVPVALITKQVLSGLDVVDESARSLPVFTREQNVGLAAAVLEASAEGHLLGHADLVRAIVDFDASLDSATDADDLFEQLSVALRSAPADVSERTVRWADRLLRGFLFIVVLPPGAKSDSRLIVKYSHTVALSGDGRLTQVVHREFEANWSSTTHVEVRAPGGTVVREMSPYIANPKEGDPGVLILTPVDSRHDGAARPHAEHMVVTKPPKAEAMVARFEVVAKRQGIATAAGGAAWLTAVLLVAVVVLHQWASGVLIAPKDGSASAILLAGPAVLLTLLSQRPEHPVVRRVLRFPRGVLLADAGLLFLAAVVAAGVLAPWLVWPVWLALSAVAVAIAVGFSWWFIGKAG